MWAAIKMIKLFQRNDLEVIVPGFATNQDWRIGDEVSEFFVNFITDNTIRISTTLPPELDKRVTKYSDTPLLVSSEQLQLLGTSENGIVQYGGI